MEAQNVLVTTGDGQNRGRAIMVYFRPTGELETQLDHIVADLAARYSEQLHFVRVDTRPKRGESRRPVVRLLRGGSIVGEALGPTLPRREVERVVLAALR